jgi:hypothetical protein
MTSLNKTVAFLFTAIAALGVSKVASSQTLTLYAGPGWGGANNNHFQNGDGGEFTAVSSTLHPNGYAATTLGTFAGQAGGFETFCVQAGSDDVTFNPGGTYNYAISEQIKAPGVVGSPDPRTLKESVAWLYSQFAQGTLVGYDFSNSLGQRYADAGILQNEIWYLEGEISNPGSNQYATDLGNNSISLTADATLDQFHVEVLNLTDGNGAAVQNQLVYNNRGFSNNGTPVPDNGLTIALIGVSFLGLAIFRRKAVKR